VIFLGGILLKGAGVRIVASRVLAAFIGAALGALPATAQVVGCPACSTSFSLTHKQIDCLAKRLEKLLTRTVDPVYFDAAGCVEIRQVMGGSPLIGLGPPAPAATADAKWLQLTKKQLACLKPRIAQLKADPDDPVDVAVDDAACQAQR
jgi:hypothetical protein